MTTISRTLISPTYWLSLEIQKDAAVSSPEGWLVSINDGTTTVVTEVALTEDVGFDRVRGLYYLPKAVRLLYNKTYEVTVQALVAGVEVGPISAAVAVSTAPESLKHSPENTFRYLVGDAIDAGEIEFEGLPVKAARDRLGRLDIVKGLLGKAGAVVELGTAYMTGETVFENSTDIDTSIAMPVSVFVKSDTPDRGEDAVNLAWLVRSALARGLSMEGYGIPRWGWSGSGPEQQGEKLIKVAMTMTLTRSSMRGECS